MGRGGSLSGQLRRDSSPSKIPIQIGTSRGPPNSSNDHNTPVDYLGQRKNLCFSKIAFSHRFSL